jgi:hypothetical protein
MDEITLIKSLIEKYPNNTLNEAETRFKIIDEILEKFLKWPKDSIYVEKYIEGNRADYILKNKADKPVLIIESKRENEYFELPKNVNSTENFQKIQIDKLLSDKNIKEAIFQVKEYCEDLLCNYAAICNGHTWIIFKVNSSNTKPWKKLPAIVIKNLNYFSEDYTSAINLLGYNSILNEDSLQSNVGLSKKIYSEIFYPKRNITAYDTPVNSNPYSNTFVILGRKFLGQIPENDTEFMENCYVSNKGHYDKLQNNVQGFLYDSLTPFFKNEGFKEFSDNKEGGSFGNKIIQIIKQQNLDNVMILFGGRGSGKSTFLKRFLFYQRPIQLDMYSKIALVDLIDSPQTIEELTTEIWVRVLKSIDQDNLKSSERSEILELFSQEFKIYQKQILGNLDEKSIEYQNLVRNFVINSLADTKEFCAKVSTRWKTKNKGLIIFLDNMDQLSVDLQDVCYLTAIEIARKLSCLVIISMREERFFNAKSKGVLDAYHTPGYHLSAPVVPDVLIKRLNYIKEKLTYTQDIELEFNIKTDTDLNTIQNFLQICIYQLAKEDSNLSKFIRYATHGDVRQALEFFKGFISSGYTNVDEISQRKYWTFQTHQVIKPMMAPDRIFYDETLSKIPNLYQLRNDNNSSHFTGLRILDLLDNKYGGKTSTGFIDAKFFVQEFDEKFSLKEDCENYLNVFLNKGLIESSNRLEEYNNKVDQIKITAFGKYLYEYLCFDFSYLDLISLDCGIYNEELNNYLIESASTELKYKHAGRMHDRIELRLQRSKRFVEYLIEQENQEAKELNLSPEDIKYSSKLSENFDLESERVRISVSKRQDPNDLKVNL